jgi:hypothetical protein
MPDHPTPDLDTLLGVELRTELAELASLRRQVFERAAATLLVAGTAA